MPSPTPSASSRLRLVRPLRDAGYRLLAGLSFALGVIGVFVPLMPTTCFMLLAVWAASRGSPRFAAWIRRHPRFGPPILAWERQRAIDRHAKYLALGVLAVSVLVLALTLEPLALKLGLSLGLATLGGWIATRPEPSPRVAERGEADPKSR